MKRRKDKYEQLAVEFKNEASLDEELDEEEVDKDDIEKEHFEEDEDDAWE